MERVGVIVEVAGGRSEEREASERRVRREVVPAEVAARVHGQHSQVGISSRW